MAVGNLTISELSPEVAELLGLDFSGDFTKGELMTLMKTYLVRNHPDRGSNANQEGFKTVSEEYKRFKDADTERSHKVHVKKTVIGKENYSEFVDNVFNAKKSAEKTQDTPNSNLPALPGSKGSAIVKRDSVNIEKFKPEPVSEGTQQNFDDILNGIDSILETLREENKLKKKESNRERRKDEERKRKKQENKLEKNPFKKLGGVVNTILKPIKSLWERVWDFIWNVFLGRTLIKLVDWFSDPENKGKLDAIGVFLKNTWPGLLALFVAFGTGLGGFITGLIRLIGGFIPKLMGLIPKMLKGLKAVALGNPLATAAVAVTAGTAIAAIAANQDGTAVVKDEKDPDKSQADEIREAGGMTGAPMSGDMFSDLPEESPQEFKEGGQVPGSGPNKDTVRAMLAPGEFVMSRGAVEKYGTDTLESMNAAGGGTNRPQKINGITYANEGGMIGEDKTEKSSSEHRSLMRKRGSGMRSKSAEGVVNGVRKSLESDTNKKSKEQLNAEKANAELLSFISKGEGGYNSMNQGTSGGSIVGSTHNASSILGKDLTEMTVGEVMEHQESGKLFAAGRYQIIPSTMKLAVARAGVSPDDQFSQSTQDKLGLSLIYNGQRPRLSAYLRKESDNLHGAMEDLAMEWASAPHPDTGRSYYPPANKSSHTVEEVKSALMSAREGGAGKYMSAAPVSSLRSRGSGMSKSRPGGGFTGAGGYGGGRSGGGSSGGGYGGMKSNVVLARKGGVEGKLDKSTGEWTAGDWSKKEKSRYMKFGGNPKKSAPEPPSQSQSSVKTIPAYQKNRERQRTLMKKNGEANSIGPKHPVPRDSAKSKTLGVLV